MSNCEKCFYAPLKNKLDAGKISFFGDDGKKIDFIFNAFGLTAEHYKKVLLKDDCPLGENGCPALYRKAVENWNQKRLEQK